MSVVKLLNFLLGFNMAFFQYRDRKFAWQMKGFTRVCGYSRVFHLTNMAKGNGIQVFAVIYEAIKVIYNLVFTFYLS